MRVTVSAELPLDAQAYLLERDGAAFRSWICEEVGRERRPAGAAGAVVPGRQPTAGLPWAPAVCLMG